MGLVSAPLFFLRVVRGPVGGAIILKAFPLQERYSTSKIVVSGASVVLKHVHKRPYQ